MAMLCLRKILFQAVRDKVNCTGWRLACRHFSTVFTSTRIKTMCQPRIMIFCVYKEPWTVFRKTLTMADDEVESEPDMKNKKEDPRARKTVGSIGRKIHHRIIHVINDDGEDLGNVHRADVIRIMDERGLKLVLLKENADPPVYRLMTGKQIHEEQLKLREKQKVGSKTGPTQIKELTFSADIAKHDLETKIKQIQQWIDKKHHVRITVKKGTLMSEIEKMEAVLNQIVENMPDTATFVNKPKTILEGKAVMCVLRHLSQKELNEYKRQQKLDVNQKETKDIPREISEVTGPSALQ